MNIANKKSKSKLLLLCILSLLLVLSSCATGPTSNSSNKEVKTDSNNYNVAPLIGDATDYSNPDNWMYKDTEATHDVDCIYFYPTVGEKADDRAIVSITKDMKDSAHFAFAETASAFEPYTNIFAPYYSQLPISGDFKRVADAGIDISKFSSYFDAIKNTRTRTDLYASLDYYFNHYNNNRPFILAGHSQGSASIMVILEEYMKVHPEYLQRMVAAYPIGFSVGRSWLENNPHLKFATGETDTGCIISWNLEGPGATQPNIVLQPDIRGAKSDTLCINPLNWKTDATPATVAENKGRLSQVHYLHSWKITEGTADATVDPQRGSLICTTNTNYETNPSFGDKSLHTYDYAEYYMNIRENGKKRIEAFLGREAK